MSEDVIKPLNEVLMSGFITQGGQVDKFEEKLIEFFKHPHILTLNSATSGLTLALRLLKDKFSLDNTSEVLSTPLTCMATNLPILANDLSIKWVDTDPNTCNMNLDDLENKINEKTKVIVLVHWGGTPVDLDRLNVILDNTEKKYGFRPYIVEDCAHAFGSEYNGKKIGTYLKNSIAVFSLQAIKHLTTGDGGIIILPDEELYNKAKLLRWYGIDRDQRNYNKKDLRLENDVVDWGYKYHMNDINATIGLYNLPHMDKLLLKGRENAKYYNEELNKVNNVKCLDIDEKKINSVYWIYTLLVEDRDEFIKYMKEKGVMCSQVHKRNDVHSCFKQFKKELKNLDEIEQKIVCIPVGWWVTEKDREYIVDCIKEFYNR